MTLSFVPHTQLIPGVSDVHPSKPLGHSAAQIPVGVWTVHWWTDGGFFRVGLEAKTLWPIKKMMGMGTTGTC